MVNRALLVAVAGTVVVGSALFWATSRGADEVPDVPDAPTVAPGAAVLAEGRQIVGEKQELVKGECSVPADGQTINMLLVGASMRANLVLTNTGDPEVTSVVLTDGVIAMMYQPGGDGDASARVTGDDYRVGGTLLYRGLVSKTFEFTVHCYW